MAKWFTFDGVDCSYEEHNTEAEALEHAQRLIDESRDYEEWPEGIEQIVVGRVTHCVEAEFSEWRKDSSGKYAYIVDYVLRDVREG